MIYHKSVLLKETIEALSLSPDSLVCDCTLGAGGHTREILNYIGVQGLVLGFDQDPSALDLVRRQLAEPINSGKLRLFNAPFSNIKNVIASQSDLKSRKVDAILADIGVSSMQLDTPERGFSFMKEGPLNMRMDQKSHPDLDFPTAYSVINFAPPELLEDIFRNYGEEPLSRKYAARIAEKRVESPFTTTLDLANFIKAISSYKKPSKKHPATRVFQALRIFVNRELDELKELITNSIDLLKPHGRLAIITFHSLEDRIVKESYRELSGKNTLQNLPRDLPFNSDEITAITKSKGVIHRPFPIIPHSSEIATNPRSRSAKLRVFIKS
jgi:16S rRNA (cytosine1402-N4)-methyltransferase